MPPTVEIYVIREENELAKIEKFNPSVFRFDAHRE